MLQMTNNKVTAEGKKAEDMYDRLLSCVSWFVSLLLLHHPYRVHGFTYRWGIMQMNSYLVSWQGLGLCRLRGGQFPFFCLEYWCAFDIVQSLMFASRMWVNVQIKIKEQFWFRVSLAFWALGLVLTSVYTFYCIVLVSVNSCASPCANSLVLHRCVGGKGPS